MRAGSKKIWPLLFALLFALNIGVVYTGYTYNKNKSFNEYIKRSEMTLEKLNASMRFSSVHEPLIQGMYAQIKGKTKKEALKIIKRWALKNNLGKNDFEAVLYQNKHEPISFITGSKDDWRLLMNTFDINKYTEAYSNKDPKIKNRISSFFHGCAEFEGLKGKQGKIVRMGRSGHRDYCVWFSDSKANIKGINGLMLTLNASADNNKKTAKKLFESFNITTRKFGYISLFQPEYSYLSNKLNADKIAEIINGLETKMGSEIIKINGLELLTIFKPSGNAFFKVINRPFVSLPIWSWALFFVWLPMWCKGCINSGGQVKISLSVLIIFLFFISIALPVIGLGAYWQLFLSSHKESIIIENERKLQNCLLQVDSGYKTQLPILLDKYKKVVDLADRRLEGFQSLIDETVNIEVYENLFDTCMLVDRFGKHIRPTSTTGMPVKRLVFYKEPFKKAFIDVMLRQGWRAPYTELNYLLSTNLANFDLIKYVTLTQDDNNTAFLQLGSNVGARILRLYNEVHAPLVEAEQKRHALQGALAEMIIEDEEQDPSAILRQGMGEFVELSYAGNSGTSYVNVIRKKDEAVYCLIIFTGNYNFSRRYLDNIFLSKNKWPKDVSYFASTNSCLHANYPLIDMCFRMPKTMSLMVPPKNINVEENARINGEENLLCSYIPQNMPTYVLSAAKPLKSIDKEINPLRKKMFYGALIVLTILVFIFISLKNAIIKPSKQIMQSIKALEKRDFEHKTSIKSGDEFEALSNTINETIEAMKEMEAAHFVQTCILPSAAVKGINMAFEGKTVSADDVGGDYFDAFAHENGELTFFLGDVSGHSVSAALVVAMAKAAFACMISYGLKYPDEIFASMSSLMFEHLHRVKMMTCFGGHVTADGLLTCSNAGQAYPFLIKENGECEIIKQVGYPLGSVKKKRMKKLQLQLPSKCRLVLFSDGFVESQNEAGEFFGYDRLEATVKALGLNMKRKDFFDSMYKRLRAHCGSVPFNDDVSVAVLDFNLDGIKD